MQLVTIILDHLTARVCLDLLEMEFLVKVRTYNYRPLAIIDPMANFEFA
jgi:hypothetical protein